MKKFIFVWLLLISNPAYSSEIIRVIDGDTLKIGETTIRLHGIDAPEHAQKCATPSGGLWPCGKDATIQLRSLVIGKSVTCDNRGADGYGRIIGVCKAGGVDVNAEMVATGLAWAFIKYADDYAPLENAARENKLGVWQADTQTPWDYRNAKWEVAVQDAPDGCPIKGNISKSGMIYHTPWSPWYSRTKVSLNKGERWFCNEAEAIAAGWRAPLWGQ